MLVQKVLIAETNVGSISPQAFFLMHTCLRTDVLLVIFFSAFPVIEDVGFKDFNKF